jgi:hypothetical protein
MWAKQRIPSRDDNLYFVVASSSQQSITISLSNVGTSIHVAQNETTPIFHIFQRQYRTETIL